MTDVKRNISDIELDSDDHADKRMHIKPGRKPLDTEPKSKRTAQNRAAQRAYRERKERKMKDLEDKVDLLESQRIQAVTETDFLRAQVAMLKKELAKYNGGKDQSTSSYPSSGSDASGSTNTGHKIFDNNQRRSTSSSNSTENRITAEFPWSRDNLEFLQDSKSNNNLPDLVSGSSSSTSPINENILISPSMSSNNTDSASSNPNTVKSNQFDNLDFTNNFEEQVDPFCISLNEACGTRQFPIPKSKVGESNTNSPFSSILTPGNTQGLNETQDNVFNGKSDFNFQLPPGGDDPLSFLNDNNFDVSLAFGDNQLINDDLSSKKSNNVDSLITEESKYDPLRNDVNLDFNFNDFVKSSLPSEKSRASIDESNNTRASDSKIKNSNKGEQDKDDDEDAVVPAPESTMKCSEIWDRVTAHPKYTEIDIDSLCSELKSKAKCSDKGVVLKATDVNELLERSARRNN